MYKKYKNHPFSLADFNQPIGLKMNPENRWVKRTALISREAIEERYCRIVPESYRYAGKTVANDIGLFSYSKAVQLLGSGARKQITENPYYQDFIGLHAYKFTYLGLFSVT